MKEFSQLDYNQQKLRIAQILTTVGFCVCVCAGYYFADYVQSRDHFMTATALVFFLSLFFFRERKHGRAVIVSNRCMERPFSLATGITLLAIFGGLLKKTSLVQLVSMWEALFIITGALIGVFFMYISLREGPAYGWRST